MSAYIQQLNEAVASAQAAREAEQARNKATKAHEAHFRLTPLENRLARLLETIPVEVQREGLSLTPLQASLRGRWRGNCHPGELGRALRRLGYTRERRWRDSESGFAALWYPPHT